MILTEFSPLEWLALTEHELLLFAGIFFLAGTADEFAVDAVWLWLKVTGRAGKARVDRVSAGRRPLRGRVGVLIPAWHEAEIIGTTIAHALAAWQQSELRLFVGCYRNDSATVAAVAAAAGGDPRLRIVILGHDGPTTKADCLNRLYRAVCAEEERGGEEFRMILLHDAEDMVDPAGLAVLDDALDHSEFVQLPVRPEPQRGSRWIAGHYLDEFAEAHAKAMVVRDALGAALPAAGVGCAFSRQILRQLAQNRPAGEGPFSVDSLTEDYELGLRIKALGARPRFLRLRGDDGQLIATRSCFPADLRSAVRQKTRWIHGIALQGWDNLGWSLHPIEMWMRVRDRRGPLTAIVLAAGYLLLAVATLLWLANVAGLGRPWEGGVLIYTLIAVNFASFVWRAGMRFAFTSNEYGWSEGVRAVLRIPLANLIAIIAGRRALFAYVGSLSGRPVQWDKTQHSAHPALMHQESAA